MPKPHSSAALHHHIIATSRATARQVKGGAQTVYPKDTIGTTDCWCGQPLGHPWPGADPGHPHGSKEGTMTGQTLHRNSVKRYNEEMQDLMVLAVSELGCNFRPRTHSILLYPPNGASPFTVTETGGRRQVGPLKRWLAENTEYPTHQERDTTLQEAAERLAEALNDPAEHPAPTEEPQEAQETAEEPDVVVFEAALDNLDDWEPYHGQDPDRPVQGFEYSRSSGWYRCVLHDTPWHCQYISQIGGHVRLNHRPDATDIHSPEVVAKRSDTRRFNNLADKVSAVITVLAEAVDYKCTDHDGLDELAEENERLSRENEKLREELAEVQAKLAIIREATGL